MIYGVISEKEMSAGGSEDQALNDGIFSFPPGMVSELPLSVWDLFDASDVDGILSAMSAHSSEDQASKEQSPAPREQFRPAQRSTGGGNLVVEPDRSRALGGRRGSTSHGPHSEGSEEEYPESEASEEDDEEVLEADMEDEEWTESESNRRRRGRAQPRGTKRSLGGSASGAASKPKAARSAGGDHGSNTAKPKNNSLWRKYGQKNLRNMKGVVRAYYKCHWPDCDAKKLVDHHKGDMSVISVNYDGKHNHDYPSDIDEGDEY